MRYSNDTGYYDGEEVVAIVICLPFWPREAGLFMENYGQFKTKTTDKRRNSGVFGRTLLIVQYASCTFLKGADFVVFSDAQ